MTIEFPTVDDWFQLARRFPEHKKANLATLKDYGAMRCMSYVEDTFGSRGKDCRILEFGHGFNPVFLSHFQKKHEVWGADKDQQLTYFGANLDWEMRFKRDMSPSTPDVRFVRELLSASTINSDIPDNYFDVIASVSVLEEVGLDIVEDILTTAYRKLRPGGVLIGTHDVHLPRANDRMPAYIDLHRSRGFEIAAMPAMPALNLHMLLIENPTSVMMWYQGGTQEDQRHYWGHFSTCFTVARKPA